MSDPLLLTHDIFEFFSIMKLSNSILLAAFLHEVHAFTSTTSQRSIIRQNQRRSHGKCTSLYQAKQFDISKPSFDLLTFRNIRGDALVRYDATNQSEPIRIQLYLGGSLIFLAAPSLVDALDFDPLGILGNIGCVVGAIGFVGLFIRECQRRSRQLDRIEKELNTQMLPIRLPANALADRRFSKPIVLKQLSVGQTTPPRIIALCGTKEKLEEALNGLRILGKRLQQASVYVVCVSQDESSFDGYEWVTTQQGSSDNIPWLADSFNNKIWKAYFNSLSPGSDDDDDDGSVPSFLWFGLNSNGRSIGSGRNEIPIWIELLGQHFRPTQDDFELMAATSTTSTTGDKIAATLSEAVESFYAALTTGDQESMKVTFSDSVSSQVTEVMDAGGRLDPWKDCLAEGARPEGMKISESEVTIISDTEAYTTVVESPANTGFDSATLLAVQKWTRSNVGGDEWQLCLHQTIPWATMTKAQGTLRCDCRGCVALTRAPARQTFGGLIG